MNATPSQHSIQGSFAIASIFVATIAAKIPAKNAETLVGKALTTSTKESAFHRFAEVVAQTNKSQDCFSVRVDGNSINSKHCL